MNAEYWSDRENDAVVAVYFRMLMDGPSRSRLQQWHSAVPRSIKGSIEFKNCNISAAMIGFGLPHIRGYQSRFNLQMSLAETVSRWLAKNPPFEAASAAMVAQRHVDTRALPFSSQPTMTNAPPPAELSQLEAIARKFDAAGKDERNRSLGKAGEERVFHHERVHLQASGRGDQAYKVRWVSQEDGDCAGYDIASFAPNGWERTPFYITRNELEVADTP